MAKRGVARLLRLEVKIFRGRPISAVHSNFVGDIRTSGAGNIGHGMTRAPILYEMSGHRRAQKEPYSERKRELEACMHSLTQSLSVLIDY